MRFLILILILALSSQALQAGCCDVDMEKKQGTPHQVNHSGGSDHDCCDTDDSDDPVDPGSPPHCGNVLHCGTCSTIFSPILPDVYVFNANWLTTYTTDFSSEAVLPSHSVPPFRPPIA